MNEQLIPCGLAESRKSQIIKRKKERKKENSITQSLLLMDGRPMNAKQRDEEETYLRSHDFFRHDYSFFLFFFLFCNPILNTSFEWVNERREKNLFEVHKLQNH